MYVCVCVCIYIYICIYVEGEGERERERDVCMRFKRTAGRATGVCENDTPFMPAFALKSCSGNCSPAPDLVL